MKKLLLGLCILWLIIILFPVRLFFGPAKVQIDRMETRSETEDRLLKWYLQNPNKIYDK